MNALPKPNNKHKTWIRKWWTRNLTTLATCSRPLSTILIKPNWLQIRHNISLRTINNACLPPKTSENNQDLPSKSRSLLQVRTLDLTIQTSTNFTSLSTIGKMPLTWRMKWLSRLDLDLFPVRRRTTYKRINKKLWIIWWNLLSPKCSKYLNKCPKSSPVMTMAWKIWSEWSKLRMGFSFVMS